MPTDVGNPRDPNYLQNVGEVQSNWYDDFNYAGTHQVYDPWLDMLGQDAEWLFGEGGQNA